MLSQTVLDALSVITEEERTLLEGSADIDRSLYMDGSRDVISGKKLLQPTKLITVRPHTRFVHFPEHTHDFVEIVYMCRGTTTHIVNGKKVELMTGELLLLGQNALQEILPAKEEDVAVNFIIRPEFFSATLSYLGDEETPLRKFIVDCLCGENETGFLHFKVSDILPVQNLLENLLWTLISDTPNKRGINQATMGLLFMQLLNHTDRLTVNSPEQEIVLPILRYVEEHYRDGSLAEVAGLLHYDAAWLSREIKRRTGKNYTDLVQDKRLSQAAWLLRNTDKKVDDIAMAVGYENISYFHRLFARRYGQSPKQYRDCK
jgi:AraC-like DNA-binding protein